MRHVAAFVLPRHAGIISPPSAMLHPEGAVVKLGLDIRERKQEKDWDQTDACSEGFPHNVSASHSLCRLPNSGFWNFAP